MKSTKRVLSAILSMCMLLGCIAVGFTAQASSADLAAAIANGGSVNWTGGDVTLTDTIVIDKDVTVDLNGAVINGAEGKSVFNIKSGNVTLYDGVVIANQVDYRGETGFIKSLVHYKPAISINGGNVTLDCITAVGSLIRVPNSGTVEVTAGNGINANKGTVLVKNTIAIGMKALDNTKADVTVEDAILIGIYKAVNQYSDVNFGEGYTQHMTVDFLKAFLKDGVSLSANEEKYIDSLTNSQGQLSAASVVVNVKDPSFSELATTYANGTLSVIAQADAHEEAGVSNRYSYSYIPDTCTIDGTTVDFTEVDGQYVAEFTGLEENTKYEATAEYNLAVKLGDKQKEYVEGALDMVASYVEKAPELLYRFVKDFENLYEMAEEYLGLAFNALTDPLAADYVAGLEDLVAIIYALEGQEYNGFADNAKDDSALVSAYAATSRIGNAWRQYLRGASEETFVANAYAAMNALKADLAADYGAIFDTDGDGVADSLFAYTNDTVWTDKSANTVTTNIEFFANGTPGFGSGVGLLDEFDKHYEAIMDLLYADSTDSFNDIGAAAKYVGDNWEDLLALTENAVVVMDKAYVLVTAEDSAVKELLDKIGLGSFASYLDAFADVAAPNGYVHKIMDRVDDAKESSFVAQYGDKAGAYCERYAEKAWKIATNLDTYFEIEVEGDYVNTIAFEQVQEVETGSDAKQVHVEVTVSGVGAAKLNDLDAATYYSEWFDIGSDITIAPVATVDGAELVYMQVKTNNSSTVVVDGTYTAKAATHLEIVLVFQTTENINSGVSEVVFMTDKALGYKWLDKVEVDPAYVADEWDIIVEDRGVAAPDFKGLTLVGWSLDKDGANVADLADLADDVAAAAAQGDVMVYAIYDYKENVEVDTQDEAIKMTAVTSEGGKAYFELSIQLPDGAKAIEAGVIATKNADLATADNMTVDLSGTRGVVFGRTSKVDANGYVLQNVLYTYGVATSAGSTVYGRGYVVYEDGTVEYTDVFSVVVK